MSKELSEKSKTLLQRSIVLLAIICVIMYFAGSLLSLMDLGCILRYGSRSTTGETSDVISQSVKIPASGNYSTVASTDSNGVTTFVSDPNGYGKWYNTGIAITSGTDVKLGITGTLSLCRAYLPAYNPEQNTSTGNLTPANAAAPLAPSAPIPIPRVGDPTFLTIMLDAKHGSWWNVAEVENNDQILVNILPERNANNDLNVSYVSSITGKTTSGDCTSGKNTYSPVCGRYSIYPASSYQGVKRCYNLPYNDTYNCFCDNDSNCTNSNSKCKSDPERAFGKDCDCSRRRYYWSTSSTMGADAPTISIGAPYTTSGSVTMPYTTNINALINNNIYPACVGQYDCDNGNPDNSSPRPHLNLCNQYCINNSSSCTTDFDYPVTPQTQYWFSANTATALLYRFDPTNLVPTNMYSIGSAASNKCVPDVNGYCFAEVSTGGQILNISSSSARRQYLQYYLLNGGNPANNTGGYMIEIQQTKCSRSNGASISDVNYANRGALQYMVLDPSLDPNADPTLLSQVQTFSFSDQGGGQYTTNLNSTTDGTLWVLINNKAEDYKDSIGDYELSILTPVAHGQFNRDALTPLLVQMNNMVLDTGMKMFGNMTCYNKDPTNCKDFFLYVRAVLNLYIVIFGLMFLMGMVQISAKDLVMRVIKVAFVAGLLNGQTYLFFNQYVFVILKNFVNEMIANIGGYNAHSQGGLVNPFMFLDGLMTKIFFSKIFFVQILSLLSFGFAGIFYFISILTFFFMMVLSLFRALTVYIMSFVGMAVLISLAPIFFTFMLFSQTKGLFDNWVKALVRFMLEPLILLVGIIILTQLVEIFLDNVLSFSVCWRCNIVFGLPFTTLGGIPLFFLDVPSFCIYWFSPWGLDYRDGLLGMSMRDLLSLGMISFCMYGYPEFASSLVGRITNSVSGATAQAAGSKVTGAMAKGAGAVAKITGFDKVASKVARSPNRALGAAMEGIHKAGGAAREGIKSKMTGEDSKKDSGKDSSPSTGSADSQKAPSTDSKTEK